MPALNSSGKQPKVNSQRNKHWSNVQDRTVMCTIVQSTENNTNNAGVRAFMSCGALLAMKMRKAL